MSENVEADGHGLRLLDISRGPSAEGAGRRRDVQFAYRCYVMEMQFFSWPGSSGRPRFG
jgi:hypothetical protein